MTQQGGQGEPFYYDAEGFGQAMEIATENRKKVFHDKWGGWGCALRGRGLKAEDAWRMLGE